MVKSHFFNHVRYEIDTEPVNGSCQHPENKGTPTLSVNVDDKKTLKFLRILIHESLHASNWHSSEEKVTQTANDIGRLLWRMGFRLRKN